MNRHLNKRWISATSTRQMPRYAPFSNSYEDLSQLTPSTLTRLQQTHRKNVQPTHRYTQLYSSTVVQTDGSTFSLQTSMPLVERVNMVKDTLMHPLWNPKIRDAQINTNTEEFIKFNKKFGSLQAGQEIEGSSAAADVNVADIFADLSFDPTAAAPVTIVTKKHVSSQQQGKKGGKKK